MEAKMERLYKHEIRRLENLSAKMGVTIGELRQRCRRADIAERRQVIAWYLHEQGYNYTRIGIMLGRHHSTMILAYNRVNDLLDIRDRNITELVNLISDGS